MDAPASFEFAKEVVTQVLTLSTGVIGLSVTFAKDINTAVTTVDRRWLRSSWIMLLVSVVFGVWTLMALTGTLATGTPADAAIYKSNITIPSTLQIVTFVAGLGLLVRHASK